MLLHAVERNEREEYRGLLDIFLIFKIFPIDAVLADFKPSGSAEHHIDYSQVAQEGYHPLPECEMGAYC